MAASSAPEPLYLSEAEIARRVVGPKRAKEWDGIAIVLERKGLPQKDPLMGGRYWPAVRAFFDRRNGISSTITSSAPDGKETWP